MQLCWKGEMEGGKKKGESGQRGAPAPRTAGQSDSHGIGAGRNAVDKVSIPVAPTDPGVKRRGRIAPPVTQQRGSGGDLDRDQGARVHGSHAPETSVHASFPADVAREESATRSRPPTTLRRVKDGERGKEKKEKEEDKERRRRHPRGLELMLQDLVGRRIYFEINQTAGQTKEPGAHLLRSNRCLGDDFAWHPCEQSPSCMSWK